MKAHYIRRRVPACVTITAVSLAFFALTASILLMLAKCASLCLHCIVNQ